MKFTPFTFVRRLLRRRAASSPALDALSAITRLPRATMTADEYFVEVLSVCRESRQGPIVPAAISSGEIISQRLLRMAEILGAFDVPYCGVIKLTSEQLDDLRVHCAPESPEIDPTVSPAAWLTGIPIVRVDNVEESTPYTHGWLP
jgi:hypothetical protein